MPDTMKNPPEGEERRGFEAEVSRLLHLMVHSVYSDREIFLRELISNASDACDKLRYAALTDPKLLEGAPEPAITIAIDKAARTLTISDTGIGMDRDDLIQNLGTIARSGTAAFLEALQSEKKADLSLIGQFGVGFYASFMVADRVRVTSRKAGDAEAHEWESRGEGDYLIRPATKASYGADIILDLKEDAGDFLESATLLRIIRTYSDHIAIPIQLKDADGKDGARTVNSGRALWTRPKSEITTENYTEFYRHVGHAMDEPLHVIHHQAEGMISFTALLFVPTKAPFDLYDPARKSRLKLYVRRVFISDDGEDLLPGWLRFLRGIVDSEDLPLNLSREMLQSSPVVRRIRKALTGKALSELDSLAKEDSARYETFWSVFGPVLKEGIYEDPERREALLRLARFRSTAIDGWTSLADYVARMKDGQSAIHIITGQDADKVARSPQLEGYRARGIEVLLLSDPVDDFWLSAVTDFEGKPLKSVTRGDDGLDAAASNDGTKDADPAPEGDLTLLLTVMRDILGEQVVDVRPSKRLTNSAVCLVADEHGLDIHLERILRQHKQLGAVAPKLLEINPAHALIKAMAGRAGKDGARAALEDATLLLLDQARISEGDIPPDPAAFAERMARMAGTALTQSR